MSIEVSHFGIHWTSDGIAFLEQGGPKGGANALGLAMKSPFIVRSRRPCNHNVPLASPALNPKHQEQFGKLAQDPLLQVMLPRPKRADQSGLWYIDDPGNDLTMYVKLLSRMSSPVQGIVVPMWSIKPPQVLDELTQTNLQPFVLIDVKPQHTQDLQKLATAAALQPRQLIMMGDPNVILPRSVNRIPTQIAKWPLGDLVILPWENYGATRVRRYMRNEDE